MPQDYFRATRIPESQYIILSDYRLHAASDGKTHGFDAVEKAQDLDINRHIQINIVIEYRGTVIDSEGDALIPAGEPVVNFLFLIYIM
ncbi:hypothetical protein LDC_1000 [sediment metagenome]|uniref:Uncharacterized protein n=1 Tax=sediment metagenome TaxID=749907 RepID=D9PHK0_9ZZZZ